MTIPLSSASAWQWAIDTCAHCPADTSTPNLYPRTSEARATQQRVPTGRFRGNPQCARRVIQELRTSSVDSAARRKTHRAL